MINSFLPDKNALPTFLTKGGLWQSNDSSLYTTPKVTGKNLLDKAVGFVKNQFNKNSTAQKDFEERATKIGVNPKVLGLAMGSTEPLKKGKAVFEGAKKTIERGFVSSAKEAIP